MILILHLVCILYILELLLLNYDCISEGSENHLKRLGTERVKRVPMTTSIGGCVKLHTLIN